MKQSRGGDPSGLLSRRATQLKVQPRGGSCYSRAGQQAAWRGQGGFACCYISLGRKGGCPRQGIRHHIGSTSNVANCR
jgi:hypothetical protein